VSQLLSRNSAAPSLQMNLELRPSVEGEKDGPTVSKIAADGRSIEGCDDGVSDCEGLFEGISVGLTVTGTDDENGFNVGGTVLGRVVGRLG
jgi:hypothetical protein